MVTNLDKILLVVMMFVLMMGMGATLTTSNFKSALKKPKGILIGFLSQFGLMPLIAFGLAHLFSMPNEIAIGIILLGCTPGGTTSNMFAYFSKGDVALSISMTVASTITAVFMMPFLLLIYASSFTTAAITIPYKNIIATLFIVIIPVIIGMVIKNKSDSAAGKVEKLGSLSGIITIIFLIVTWVLRNWHFMTESSWTIYLIAILIGVIGYLFGYGASALAGLDSMRRRTVSLETGIQNTPLTATIILLSFQEPLASQVLYVPIFYGLFIVVTSVMITLLFRRLVQKEN